MYKTYKKVIDFSLSAKSLSLSLFNSQGYFWLTSAISFAFAAEELKKCLSGMARFNKVEVEPWDSRQLVDFFKESLKKGEVSPEVEEMSKEASLHNLKILTGFSQKYCSIFDLEGGIVLGKTFFAHWLIYKIIELEWQQVLDREEVQENYLLLDAFIEETQDLDELEEKYLSGRDLSLDERLYLRGHWERVNVFWSKVYQDLELLKGGWISFKPSYLHRK